MPDWNTIYQQIEDETRTAKQPYDAVRHRLLKQFHEKTGRNVITYYSGWLQKTGPQFSNIVSITDEDKNGFMACFHKLDFSKGLDLILHLPGGNVAATESIIDYIRAKFGADVRTFVPQLSMSGGTMIALSGNEIWMGLHSNLGPIDPQFGPQPARLVLEEVETAYKEIQADPQRMAIWSPILAQIPPTYLSACKHAIQWSRDIAIKTLANGMFLGDPAASAKATSVADQLTDFATARSHSRHLHRQDCQGMGLNIRNLEDDQSMQDAVLSVHHATLICLMQTPAAKIIENHNGIMYGKAIGA
ncbi:hypothetical protein LUX29_21485 [Aureimonas altamirensis]|uniref:SDH family Clp fold serine proteinase n=1 Tax=Aureimonas altamirensis TaxID=370622 RepID=UPI001E6008DE|nr:hypothetical protein [Aureimonas altamirensis]UHD45528.1 hypothetical protein LUX29_21485 [Aureimonas altamirensis]